MTHKISRLEPISERAIEKLRKDALLLNRNVKRVKTVEQARELREGSKEWARYLRKLFNQISAQLKAMRRDPSSGADPGWIEHYLDNQDPLWEFQYELRSPPEIPSKPERLRDDYVSDGSFYERDMVREEERRWKKHWTSYLDDLRKWGNRVRRKARKAWKWLQDFSDWTQRTTPHGGGGEAVIWNTLEKEVVEIEGFRVLVQGYDPSRKFHREGMAQAKAGLDVYRDRAKKVLPWLIRNQLPMRFNFEGDDQPYETAAYYAGDEIVVTPTALHAGSGTGAPRAFAKVMAHEMGHHLWQQYLGQTGQEFWTNAVNGDFGPLDVGDVLSKLKDGETVRELGKRIKDEDPVLYLKLRTLMHQPQYEELGLFDLERIEKAVSRGYLNPTLQVPSNPITGYAGKNPEEAFCETVGLLVVYGPRATLPKARFWIKQVLPRIKTSAQKVAAIWLSRRR